MAEGLHRPSKRLGQNFLKDSEIASKIVSLAHLGPQDTVLEPGAGRGILTERLMKVAGKVIAVEKDKRLAQYLRVKFSDTPSVEIIQDDVLKTSLPRFNRVVGTPPYYISSRLVTFLLASSFESAHLVFQKEFGERLLAHPGAGNYGRISVTSQRGLGIMPLILIPRTCFEPRPRVDSVLLGITPRMRTESPVSEQLFADLVRVIFTQRKRLLRKALSTYLRRRFDDRQARSFLAALAPQEIRVYQLSVELIEKLCIQLQGVIGVPGPQDSRRQ